MRRVLKAAVKFASKRKQFGRRISTFGAIQGKLARIAMMQYVCECVAYMIASNMDMGFFDFYVEAAISKCFASKAAWDTVDETIQIYGVRGYRVDVGLEKALRDIRWFRTFNGTNDILRLFISLTGIQHVGVENMELQAEYNDPVKHLGLIFGRARRHINTTKEYYGMTPSISHLVHPRLHDAAHIATKSFAKFGPVVHLLLERYGRKLVDEQYYLIKLANAAIQAYAMVSTLSRCSMSIYSRLPSYEHEITLTEAFCMSSSAKMDGLLNALEDNKLFSIGQKLSVLAEELVEANGCVNNSPLGF